MRRMLFIAPVVICAAAASSAQAATVSIADPRAVTFQAAPGEANNIVIQSGFKTRRFVLIRDTGAIVTPVPSGAEGQACVPVNLHEVICTSVETRGGYTVHVIAGDRNDRVTDGGAVLWFDGGTGDDTAIGDDLPDILNGGPGNDVLKGNGSLDNIDGGPGNDRLYGGDSDDMLTDVEGNNFFDGGGGNDEMAGGPGTNTFIGGSDRGNDLRDAVFFNNDTTGVVVTNDGIANDGEPGENGNVAPDVETIFGTDNADTLTNFATDAQLWGVGGNDVLTLHGAGFIYAGRGDDTLNGSPYADILFGEEGNDVLTGGAGPDDLQGMENDDTIFARDGAADKIACDGGIDSVQLDIGIDTDVNGCETTLP
jgi:Ca2+-binding RTX toxin-like protein